LFFIEALISTEAPHGDHPFHTQERITIGVADGVSSWQRYGVNPALFAWELMVRCEEVASSSGKLEAQIGKVSQSDRGCEDFQQKMEKGI